MKQIFVHLTVSDKKEKAEKLRQSLLPPGLLVLEPDERKNILDI